jgi:curved DNA binding protein
MSDSDEERTPQQTEEDQKALNNLSDQKIVTKYKVAGDIADRAVKHVAGLCVVDAKIIDLCTAGDAFITDACNKVYLKPKIEKGIAFPTCVSVNHVIGHFCPPTGDEVKLAAGDLLKIDLAVHIDGYVACMAHTVRLGDAGVEDQIPSGRQADVMAAAWTASEAAIRTLKPGRTNSDVSAVIAMAAAQFNCSPVQGVLSHQMSRFVIDGEKVILNKPDVENKVEQHEFEVNECYCLDIVMSTADGKAKESDLRTTIYKRAPDVRYALKMKASRAVFSSIMKNHPTFPFTLRYLQDEKKARFAITECLTHELLHPYPVLVESAGQYIAHMKFTCLITESGTLKICGDKFHNRDNFQSEHKVTDKDLIAVLNTGLGAPGKKKKKKKQYTKPKKLKHKRKKIKLAIIKYYKIDGDNKAVPNNPPCKKCDDKATFMAKHHDRYTCGRCGYTLKREE